MAEQAALATAALTRGPAATIDRLLTVAGAPTSDLLDPKLWGPAPRGAEVSAALVANLRAQFDGRRALEATSVSRAEVAGLLGISEQAVTDALESGRLLGLKRGRRWAIPAWQLDAEAERGIVPGIAAVAAVFPGGPVALSVWVTRPNADLDGRSPRAALLRGDVKRVVDAASALTAAGW